MSMDSFLKPEPEQPTQIELEIQRKRRTISMMKNELEKHEDVERQEHFIVEHYREIIADLEEQIQEMTKQ